MIERFTSNGSFWQGFPAGWTTCASPSIAPAPTTPTPGAGEAAAVLSKFSQMLNLTLSKPGELVPVNAPRWLEDVYSHVDRADPESAVDILFSKVNAHLLAGEVDRCNELLRALDLKRVDTNSIVAALSITLAAADRLPYRKRFVERAARRLQELAPGRVERLLSGLR
jgi:hypothetical protein